MPTPAHRAVASLVQHGFIRVVVTTNFDRLMEQALEEAGIHPQVIASPDAVDGALPLVHAPCTVFKVHGDYLDTRMMPRMSWRSTITGSTAYSTESSTNMA